MNDMKRNQWDHATFEKRWQGVWTRTLIDVTDISSGKRPFYNLMMFPYPSAEGLHIGNMYAITGSDIYGRFKRMQGYDVFEPIGLDGFGIHSENYALKVGRHPMDHAAITEKHFYDQLHQIGAMFDFTRTLETYDPNYYRWTQWLFIQMFKAGLAYRAKAEVNFCPSCKTVLADEQVIDSACERCGNTVEKRALEQWFFRITAYAEKLLKNIPSLKWAEKVKIAQEHWIGKKEGINITYPVVTEDGEQVGEITCFTTRPGTNFGATFVVIAPEHEFVARLLKVQNKGIQEYVTSAKQKSDADRGAEGRKKTGVFTGCYCLNQLNNIKMPLYISDFVLANFGTGAVVGVPGHDKRDFQFAKAFQLPVKRVVVAKDGDRSAIIKEEQVEEEEEGVMVNSGFLDGLDIQEATIKMMDYLSEKGWGKCVSTFHLRDWLISRQRYWGPPIPMVYCRACAKEGKGYQETRKSSENSDSQKTRNSQRIRQSECQRDRKSDISECSDISDVPNLRSSESSEYSGQMSGWFPVPEDQLPVALPRIEDYKPSSDGIAPLSKHKEFFDTVCPCCGKPAVRETDVSDTFLDSSWYFLRYPSLGQTKNQKRKNESSLYKSLSDDVPFSAEITKRWLPVHMYTGGAEHSVLHLLYSRYITMVLHDLGYLDFDEPFANFYAHGLIIKDGAKMSKSKGNVVNPDEYIAKYGADSVRLYLMFIGPFSMGGDFRDTGMEGMRRWLDRVWRIITASLADRTHHKQTAPTIIRLLHKTIAKLTDDIEKRRYNTSIASLMELTNAVSDEGGSIGPEELKKLILLLAPFAPHIAEEAWNRLHGRETYTNSSDSVHCQPWPSYDPTFLTEKEVCIIVQVNGKLRDSVVVPVADASNQAGIEEVAKTREQVRRYLTAPLKKTVFVPGKLINFVV